MGDGPPGTHGRPMTAGRGGNVRHKRIIVAVAVATLLLVGCSGRSGTETSTESEGGSAGASEVSTDFGDLADVCQSGSPKGSPTQGVTDSQIEVGVFSDVGFTKNSEF